MVVHSPLSGRFLLRFSSVCMFICIGVDLIGFLFGLLLIWFFIMFLVELLNLTSEPLV